MYSENTSQTGLVELAFWHIHLPWIKSKRIQTESQEKWVEWFACVTPFVLPTSRVPNTWTIFNVNFKCLVSAQRGNSIQQTWKCESVSMEENRSESVDFTAE